MSSPLRKDLSSNNPLPFNEWLPKFHNKCSAVSKVKAALSRVPDQHLHDVCRLVWIYVGRFTLDKVSFVRSQSPPGGMERFLRDLNQLATQIASYNDSYGARELFSGVDAEILHEKIANFQVLPQLIRDSSEWVESYLSCLQELFIDRNRSLTRILILLARYFADRGELGKFNDIGAIVDAGYAAQGNQKSHANTALAIRQRLNRYREANPTDFIMWFNYEGDLPDLLDTAVHTIDVCWLQTFTRVRQTNPTRVKENR